MKTFKNSVKVAAIKTTSTTREYTGLDTYDEIVESQDSLFKKLTGTELMSLVKVKLYKDKLNEEQEKMLASFSKEELRQHAIDNLTFQLEIEQGYDKGEGSSESKIISMFLSSRINVSDNVSGVKKDWITTTLAGVQVNKIKVGTDLTQLYLEQGHLMYIMRRFTFDPEFRDGRIISSPYRAGKGGDILTKNNKLVFMKTETLIVEVADEQEALEAYNNFELLEKLNREEFKRDDQTKDRINALDWPEESKDKNGFFNPDFEEKLTMHYAQYTQGLHVEVE